MGYLAGTEPLPRIIRCRNRQQFSCESADICGVAKTWGTRGDELLLIRGSWARNSNLSPLIYWFRWGSFRFMHCILTGGFGIGTEHDG
jgi:hypothetical protein